ncbi:MAG TPA: DUF1146 family protein [Virgibacillus sp.]|nr:DUF1146 family protein [Virgibacillus sp.]
MISIGLMSVISIVSHLFFICVTWYVLQAINLSAFMRKGHEKEIKILLLFITIAIGTSVSHFFLDILQWSQDLNYLL